MRKTLTYCSFMVTSLVIILVFVSATTYLQLAFAIILYIPLVYFAFKVIPQRRVRRKTKVSTQFAVKQSEEEKAEILKPKKESWTVADIDKRAFLKLIGGAGLALFL